MSKYNLALLKLITQNAYLKKIGNNPIELIEKNIVACMSAETKEIWKATYRLARMLKQSSILHQKSI